MIEIKNETEKVILVGVSLSDQDDTKESLEELKDLVSTAGAETVGRSFRTENSNIREPMSEKERLKN